MLRTGVYGCGMAGSTKPRWRNTATFLTVPSGIACSALSRREKANTGTRPAERTVWESSSIKKGAPPNITLSPDFAPAVMIVPIMAMLRTRRISDPGSSSNVRNSESCLRSSSERSITPCARCSGVERCWVAFQILTWLST